MSACCVNNINRHSRQRQSSPRRALTLRSLLPLTSPPIKDLISVQMLFGKLSLVHIHSYLALLHRCCLTHVYPSPSSAFSPLLLPPSLSLFFHLLLVTNAVFLSICSFFPPSFPSSLLPFIFHLPFRLSLCAQPRSSSHFAVASLPDVSGHRRSLLQMQ